MEGKMKLDDRMKELIAIGAASTALETA